MTYTPWECACWKLGFGNPSSYVTKKTEFLSQATELICQTLLPLRKKPSEHFVSKNCSSLQHKRGCPSWLDRSTAMWLSLVLVVETGIIKGLETRVNFK